MTTRIIAIDGFGGAGKSTLAAGLSAELSAQVVHTDDFASWDEPLDWWPRLRDRVLVPLSENRSGRFQRYDWDQRALADWIDVPVAPILIVEGVSSSREEFRRFLAFSIWIETPADERLRRGLERDGDGALSLWRKWMSDEDEWAARQHPRDHVDAILSGTDTPSRTS
jgi:uridine kinase